MPDLFSPISDLLLRAHLNLPIQFNREKLGLHYGVITIEYDSVNIFHKVKLYQVTSKGAELLQKYLTLTPSEIFLPGLMGAEILNCLSSKKASPNLQMWDFLHLTRDGTLTEKGLILINSNQEKIQKYLS